LLSAKTNILENNIVAGPVGASGTSIFGGRDIYTAGTHSAAPLDELRLLVGRSPS